MVRLALGTVEGEPSLYAMATPLDGCATAAAWKTSPRVHKGAQAVCLLPVAITRLTHLMIHGGPAVETIGALANFFNAFTEPGERLRAEVRG
jgi:hypothetical protein